MGCDPGHGSQREALELAPGSLPPRPPANTPTPRKPADIQTNNTAGRVVSHAGALVCYPPRGGSWRKPPRHKMIIGTGAGTRARHAYSVGLDLGVPTGVLSVLGFFVSIQNAKMIHYLLAKHGIPSIEPAQFAQLPLYLAERQACVCVGMPPYAYWQPNPAIGRIPPHRTHARCYLISEVLGARSMIYIKDEEGLYTADPKKDRNARFIPKITVEELEQLDLIDVVLERTVFELMKTAKHRRSVQVINGLKKGNLTRALDGEPVGTIITA